MVYKKTVLCIFLLVSILGLFFFIQQRNSVSIAVTGEAFREENIGLNLYELYDVGVADINLDGLYDIFTVNHSARQSVLINKGSGEFVNEIDKVGLSQDSEYANVENRGYAPEIKKPGLYIYRKDKKLHIKSYELKKSVSAVLTLPWPISIVAVSYTHLTLPTTPYV